MLEGKRFLRLFPGVWCLREHDMSEADWFVAAGMALPDRAHLTGTSRLQQLGLDHGPRRCTMVTSLSRRWRRSP